MPLAISAAPSSGAATPDPPVTAGLQLWYEANTTDGSNGQPVTAWPDKSGLGRTLSALDPSQAATMRRNAINGRAALEFNGTSSLLKTYNSTFTIGQPDTFFIVYRSLDPNSNSRAFVFDSRNSSVRQVFGRPGPGQERLYANIDLDFGGFTYPFDSFGNFSGTFNGASSSLYKNGTLVGTGNAGGAAMDGFAVGGLSTGGQWGYDLTHSLVAEILVYSGALSSADRQAVTGWLDEKYNVSGPPTPPANTGAPAVTGSTVEGATLTASNGTWTGSLPLTYTYQWSQCDSSGANCTPIAGASSSTYVVQSNDLGSRLAVAVTATNGSGSATASSPPTSVVTASPPANTALPAISGTTIEGSTLTTTNGTWTGTTPIAFAYQWRRCDNAGAGCTNISATTASYTLTNSDVGSTIRVVVTASNGAGSTPATSPQTFVVGSAGGGPTQPPVSAGLQLWYEANTQTVGDGQAVNRWSDQSGNGRDLTAFDAVSAPTLRRNAVNGRAAIEFNGTSSILKTYGSTFTISQPDTFFIVYKALDLAPSGHEAYIFDSTNSNVRQLLGLGPFTNTEMYADIDIEAPTAYPFPNYQIWSGTFQGSSSTVFKNGTLIATGPAGNSGLSGFTVGGLSTGAQYGYLMSHSLVAEILYYSGAMTAPNRQAVTDWLNQKYNVMAPLVPPSNTAPPAISGTARDGSTLTSSTGSWSGSTPFTFTYQWQRCDSAGANCSNIGANSAAYVATSADVGSRLKVTVTAGNGAGSAQSTSALTAVVTASAPANTTPPAITGTAKEGMTLTATNGAWTGTSPLTFTYAWGRCDAAGANCLPIATANAQTYVPDTSDVGFTLRVTVTATNGIGNASATSSQTAVVVSASAPPPPGSPPVTTGLQVWYEADRLSAGEGQAVSQWDDLSGNGRDLTAFDNNAAPTMRRNALNGRAAIEFNGTNSLLKTYGSTFTISQPDTYFVVYKSLDSTGSHFVFDSTNSNVRQLVGLAGSVTEMYANIALNATTAYPFPNYQLWSGTFNGASSSIWKNGTQVGAGNAGGSALSGLAVGGLSTSGQYGYELSHSLVAEILFYSGSLTAAERQSVSDWLNQKYALY